MKKFTRLQRPVIADEWAHVACYPYDFDIKTDPTARNFWGKSLKLMWENAFVSNGTAGGAIWGMIDETFQLPDKCVGYGEWGIYDTWRRKKPEFWLTKKAYSPIRIDESTYVSISDARDIEIPVKNWFDHTDFNELAIRWQVGDNPGTIKMSLPPGKEGKLIIPAKNFKGNDVVGLCFYDQFGKQPMLIDEFKLPLREKTYKPAEPDGPAPKLSQDDNEIVASGVDFEIIFDKQTGSVTKGAYNGQVLILGGPRLNLSPLALSTFVLKKIDADIDKGSANIHITGSYGTIEAIYNISIDGKGTMQTMYSIKNPPKNPKSYNEVGLAFDVTNDIDVLKWERNGLYSVYPKDHIGRNKGTAKKVSDGKDAAYRERPKWDWNEDMHDFFYIGSEHQGYDMTHDFRSTKEHIYQAVIADSKTGNGLQLQSDGRSHAVRMGIGSSEIINKKQTLQMYINCDWAYTLGWGNIDRKSQIRENFSDSIKIRFINGSSE